MSNTGQIPELESLRSQVADLARELTVRDQAQLAQRKEIDGELQDLRKQSDLLQAIVTGTAADTGDTFFTSLALHLTATLNMQYAVIGEVLEKTSARIRTLAVSSGGTLLENFECDLAAAPCGTGLTESFWCYEQGVQALFQNFPPQAAMGVESHSGVAIRSHQGKVVGFIVVMDTKPIASQDRLQTLLNIFAPRAAAELSRKQAEHEHRHALHELQNIMETVPDIMFTLNPQGDMVKWNRRVEEVTGYSSEELHNKSALAFVPAREQEQTALAIQRAFTHGKAELEGHLLTKDQRTIPYHWTGAALKDPQGRVIGITGIGRDVSAQKKVAQALHHQRQHLLQAQALAHLGSWEWDIESGETEWSEEQFRIFGHEPGAIAVTYDTFLAALLPDDHDRVLAAINHALLGKCPLDVECRIVRPNGDIRVIHMRADIQRDATGHLIGMAGTVLDITERKHTEEALRASEERWHLAIEGSNDGIWDWNIKTGEIFFSARWKAMRGFADHEVRNHIDEWRSRIHPDDLDRVLRSIDHYLAKQTSAFCEEYRVQRKDGSYMWILDRGVVIRADDGTPLRMAGSESDITDRKRAEELLCESVMRFDLAVQGAQDGLWYAEWVSDNLFAPHNPIYYSPRMKEIMGVEDRSMPDVLGTWLSLVHPDDLPKVLTALTQHLEQRSPYDVEYRILQEGTGAIRWIGAKGQAVWDSSGQPMRMAGSFSDITKRKRAEEALRTSREKLQQALRASHTGLWDWNTESNETSFSREWKQQLGFEEAELADAFESWESLLHPEDYDRVIAYVQAYLANPEGDYQQEFRLRHKDGTYRWIEARAAFVSEPDGRRVRLLGSHTDVTERKQEQEKRYQSEAQLQAILDNSPSLIFLKDSDGRYLKVNREFETAFQLTSDEIIGRTDRDLFSPEQAALFQMNDQKVLEGRKPLLVEEVSSQGGHTRVAIVHKFPLRDEQETLYAIGGIATDITERKKIEDALKLSEARLTEAQRVAHIGSWELDIIANHLWWSDEVFCIFEIDSTRSAASYQAFLEIVHPEDRQFVDRSYTESVASHTPYNIEHRLLLPDGRVKHVHERCETFYDIAGTPLRSLGTVQDITERKNAELALRDSEARTRSILETALDAVVSINDCGLIIGWNPQAEDLFGYSPHEVLGLPLDETIIPTRYRQAHAHGMNRMLQSGDASAMRRRFEFFALRRDGHEFPVEFAIASTQVDGQPMFTAFIRDITERKQAEVSLRESEERYRTLVELSPSGVFVYSEGRTVYVNSMATTILGATEPNDILVRAPFEFIHPDYHEDVTTNLRRVLAGESTVHRAERVYLKMDGTPIHVQVEAVRITWNGKPAIQGFFSDITERKQAEHRLRLTQFTIDHAVDAIYWIDPQANIVDVNEAASEMLGYSKEDLCTMTVYDINPDCQADRWPGFWAETRLRGTMAFETSHRTRDGCLLPVEIQINYVSYEGQEFHCAFVRDITERKRAQEELRWSKARLSYILENNPAVVYTRQVGNGWPFTFITPNVYELLGYTSIDILTDPDRLDQSIHPDDDRDMMTTGMPQLLRDGARTFVYRLRHRDGRYCWIENRARLTADGQGTLQIVGTMLDITQRKQAEQALATSERQLRTVLDSLPIGVWFTDEKGHVLYGNPVGHRIWAEAVRVGLPQPDGDGLWWETITRPEAPHRWAVGTVLARGHDVQNETLAIETRVGERRTIRNSAVPVKDETGGMLGAIVLNEDITDRVRAEKALHQEHALLMAVMDAATDTIFVKDLEGRYIHINRAGAQALGIPVEEVIGWNDYALWPSDLVASCQLADRRVLETGEPVTVEETSVGDGKTTIYLTTKAPYRDAAGNMIGIIGVAHDISQIKQSEDELRRSHAFIRQIIDTDPNFIFAKDRDGRFTLANKALADAYGTTVDHMIGKTDADFPLKQSKADFLLRENLKVMDSLQEFFLPEESITDARGRTRWLQTVKRPIFDEQGRASMVLGACTDITERKQMEETLRQQERDLRTAIEERERISQDLHDGILQSLYAVGLGLEACKPLMTQQHYKKAAMTMDRAIGQLNHVMSEVRNFIAGLESQILQGSTFPTALRTMILALTADHPTPCTLTIDERLTKAFSTEQALHLLNVVREALSNSLRHAGATKMTVSLKSLSRSIRLTIADNGRGFDPASMFGMGHGLANMEARARKVRGRFAIRSVPQHGTRITIDLPKENCYVESESKHGSTVARR